MQHRGRSARTRPSFRSDSDALWPIRASALPLPPPALMPALHLFGRRWGIASDDIPLIMAPIALFHAGWTAVVGVGLALTAAWPPVCDGREHALAALGGLLATAATTTALAAWLTVEGLKGAGGWGAEGGARAGGERRRGRADVRALVRKKTATATTRGVPFFFFN